MKLMNLFNRKGESSETSFGSNDKSSKAFFISKEDYDEDKIHSKEFKELAVTLAKKIGIEKAAEELKCRPVQFVLGRKLSISTL